MSLVDHLVGTREQHWPGGRRASEQWRAISPPHGRPRHREIPRARS